MGVLYTKEEIQNVLLELRIKPVDGNLITTSEAARILTWRAKAEQSVIYQYPDNAIRGHVQQGKLQIARRVNARFNLFKVEDIFDLQIAPRRGLARREVTEDATWPPVYGGKSQHKIEHLVGASVS